MGEYWKGDNVPTDFAARLLGSGDIYDQRGRRPWSSVNFITAHDGFTLNDLVSYNEKHNEANGEHNNDGHNDNRSYNYGAEGPTEDEGINAVRERQKRNFLVILFFSHGTPMLLAGDEFGRSQMGNNNGYCQDSDISWVHWENLPDSCEELREFTRTSSGFARHSRFCVARTGATVWMSNGSTPAAASRRPNNGTRDRPSAFISAGAICRKSPASGTMCCCSSTRLKARCPSGFRSSSKAAGFWN